MSSSREPRDPTVARFVFDLLYRASIDRTQAELADATCLSKATISNIIAGRGSYGVGRKVAESIAKAFGFEDYKLFQSYAFNASINTPRGQYANREALILRHMGRWSPPTLAAARSLSPTPVGDPKESWWMTQLDRLEQAVSSAILPNPSLDQIDMASHGSWAHHDYLILRLPKKPHRSR